MRGNKDMSIFRDWIIGKFAPDIKQTELELERYKKRENEFEEIKKCIMKVSKEIKTNYPYMAPSYIFSMGEPYYFWYDTLVGITEYVARLKSQLECYKDYTRIGKLEREIGDLKSERDDLLKELCKFKEE